MCSRVEQSKLKQIAKKKKWQPLCFDLSVAVVETTFPTTFPANGVDAHSFLFLLFFYLSAAVVATTFPTNGVYAHSLTKRSIVLPCV
jgi:hypothetical protein